MLKKGELYRILYRLVENMTDRRKLYNFFKKFLGVFTDDSELINPDILPNNLGDIMDTSSNVIKSKYLPSYVDDVLEGYYVNGIFYKIRTGIAGSYAYSEPYEPETGKIYVDLNEDSNPTYRWSGSAYIVISASCNDRIIILKTLYDDVAKKFTLNYSYEDIVSMITDDKHNYVFYCDAYDGYRYNARFIFNDKKDNRLDCYLDWFNVNIFKKSCFYITKDNVVKYDMFYIGTGTLESTGNKLTSYVFNAGYDTSTSVYPSMNALNGYIDKARIDTFVPTTPTNTKMLSTKATLDYIDTKIRTFDKNNVVLNSQLNPFTGDGNEANVVENNKDDSNNNTATAASKCHIEGSGNKINDVSVGHIEGTLNTVESTGIVHVEGWNNTLKGESAIHVEGAYVNLNSTGTGVKNSYVNGAHVGGIHPVDRTNKAPFSSDNIVRQIGCGSENVAKDAVIVTEQGKVYIKGVGEFDGLGEEPTNIKDVATIISDINTKTTTATSDIATIKTNITNITADINTIDSNIDKINDTLEAHDTSITTNATNISNETTRAKGREDAIESKVTTETSERKTADSTLTTNLNKEIEDRKAADTTLTNNLTTETTERKAADNNLQNAINEEITNRENAVTTEATARKGGDDTLTTKITTEEKRAKDAESAISTKVTAIEGKIPAQASAENQLADKEFVNSSIATATATFRGTYNTLVELNAVTEGDKNDYAFYKHTDEAGNTLFDKYVYDGMDWQYQYSLNNSSFTAAQWAAINSEVTKESIKTINDKVSANETAITTEHNRAVKAEQANATAITTETNARTSADTALGTRIDNVVTSVNTEKTDRETAITNLTKSVTANATKIIDLSKTVDSNTKTINGEITDRQTAVDNINTKITNNIMPYIGVNSVYDINVNETITLSTFTMLINMINANNHYIIRIHDDSNKTNPISIATYQKTADDVITLSYMSNEYTLSYIKYTLSNNTITQEGPVNYNIKDKQNTISDLSTIRSNAANGQTAYNWGNHTDAGYNKLFVIKGLSNYATDRTIDEVIEAINNNYNIVFIPYNSKKQCTLTYCEINENNAITISFISSDLGVGYNDFYSLSYNSNKTAIIWKFHQTLIPVIDYNMPTSFYVNHVLSSDVINKNYALKTDVNTIRPLVISIDNVDNTISTDTSFAEFKSAINANQPVIFIIGDGTSDVTYQNPTIIPSGDNTIYTYLHVGGQVIGITYVDNNGTDEITIQTLDIAPTIDTSIPTTLTDNTVPSTKLLIDTFVNNQQTLYLLVTSVNDINTYDELEVVTEFVQNMTAFNFNAANHKLGSKITENTFLSYDRFLPYIDKGYFVKLCFYGKINNGYYVTIDLGLIHDIGFNNVHYNIVCISQFGLIYGNVSKDDNGNIKFTFERPIYQSTIKTDYQRLIEAESRITALETALANVQTQLQNI